MIEVQFWSERNNAYFCQWDGFSGYLTEEDLDFEEKYGDEVIWNCAAQRMIDFNAPLFGALLFYLQSLGFIKSPHRNYKCVSMWTFVIKQSMFGM